MCGETELMETNGTLMTPRYPDDYPNNWNCQWIIRVTESMVREVILQSNRLDFCAFDNFLWSAGETPHKLCHGISK